MANFGWLSWPWGMVVDLHQAAALGAWSTMFNGIFALYC